MSLIRRPGRSLRPAFSPSSVRAPQIDDRPASSPKVERTPTEVTVTLVRQGPRLLRDKIFDLFQDGAYHSAHEIAGLSPSNPGGWYSSLQELLDQGYTFERDGNRLCMRVGRRTVNARNPPQDLHKLLAGIDATKPDFRRAIHATEPMPSPMDGDRFVEPVDDSLVDMDSSDAQGPFGDEHGSKDGRSHLGAPPSDDDALILTTEPNCMLPARVAVTSTRAILAKKSSGKTYLAMVIAEEFLRLTTDKTPFPFVVLDPTGVWHGLCADVDGQPSPHKILVLGGEHGAWPLEATSGDAVAELVVSLWPHPVILDVSDLMVEEQHQFAADFGAKLYTINRKPLHIFIDEADEYMPQKIESGNKVQHRCLGVFDRLVRRGRVKGIGSTLITQRPAVISKNVLSQVDGIYVLNVIAPHDIEAVDTWMRPAVPSSDRNMCLEALPSLSQGEVFFIQAHLKAGALIKFRTRKKTTFDSSRTPTVDDPDPTPPVLSRVDRDVWEAAGKALGFGDKVAKAREADAAEAASVALRDGLIDGDSDGDDDGHDEAE